MANCRFAARVDARAAGSFIYENGINENSSERSLMRPFFASQISTFYSRNKVLP